MKRPLTSAVAVAAAIAFAAALWGARAITGSRVAEAKAIQPVATEQVLEWIGQGKRVIFVDARESQEFDEEHIPGAINMSLRELAKADAGEFAQADLIVAYCMKDFRGYEVAKALRRAGFPQATIIREYGIGGWKKQGLPTVVRDVKSEQVAHDELTDCARSPGDCLKDKG